MRASRGRGLEAAEEAETAAAAAVERTVGFGAVAATAVDGPAAAVVEAGGCWEVPEGWAVAGCD